MHVCVYMGFSWWLSDNVSTCHCGRGKRCGFDPWVRKIPWIRKWQPTAVFLPGKSHGERILMGYTPWGCRVRHNLATEHTAYVFICIIFFSQDFTAIYPIKVTAISYYPWIIYCSFLKHLIFLFINVWGTVFKSFKKLLEILILTTGILSFYWRASILCMPVHDFHIVITYYTLNFIKTCLSLVAQSCPTLCEPMDCSMSGFPVHHQLPKLTQIHVHRVSDAIQLSHPLSSHSPPAFNLFQHQDLFQWVSYSHQVAKVL